MHVYNNLIEVDFRSFGAEEIKKKKRTYNSSNHPKDLRMGACASVPIDLKNAKAPEPAKEETEPAVASNEQEEQVKTEEGHKEEKPVTSSDEVSIP